MYTKYMKNNTWTQKYVEMYSHNYESKKLPQMHKTENGYILPLKEQEGYSWGVGGVVDSHGVINQFSCVGIKAFGGSYIFEKEKVSVIEDKVIFIGILPKHWGHFITDTVSRLWFVLDAGEYKNCKIAVCTWGWGNETKISGNYADMFRYLGIDPEKIILVRDVIKAREIIVPDPVMGYETKYHRYYKDILEFACQNALTDDAVKNLEPYKKVYFTRTHFLKSKLKEVGEKEIEKDFERAGYKIFAPESLSLCEQIFYIRHCERMAAISGTITHNAIFSKNGLGLTILNRTCVLNPPQVRINQLFDVECIYVDVYSKAVEQTHREYGVGPILIEENNLLIRYFNDIEKVDVHKSVLSKVSVKVKNQMVYRFLSLINIIGTNYLIRKLYNAVKTKSTQY